MFYSNVAACLRAALLCASIAGAPAVSLERQGSAPDPAETEEPEGVRERLPALFVAGIEGTSHHFFYSVHEACVWAGRCMTLSDKMAHALWFKRDDLAAVSVAWRAMKEYWYKEMKKPRYHETKLMTLMLIHENMMFSYPSGNPIRPWLYGVPRLDIYYRAAMSNHDVLKVIVLLRRANDSLASAAFRFNRTADKLVEGTRALNEQLLSLPAGSSFMCVSIDGMPQFGEDFQRFLGISPKSGFPYFNYTAAIHELWSEYPHPGCPLGPGGCDVPALEAAVDRTHEICRERSAQYVNQRGQHRMAGAPGSEVNQRGQHRAAGAPGSEAFRFAFEPEPGTSLA